MKKQVAISLPQIFLSFVVIFIVVGYFGFFPYANIIAAIFYLTTPFYSYIYFFFVKKNKTKLENTENISSVKNETTENSLSNTLSNTKI